MSNLLFFIVVCQTIKYSEHMELLLIIFLILLSGLFSGLNLGLMSLDPHALKRKIELGDTLAAKVYPVRQQGNLLLVTLLLGNVAVNSALAIFLGSLVSGFIAGIFSTLLITVFGEIIPQAAFSRFALAFGAKSAWFVTILLWVFYPICKPMAWLLDKMLGAELPNMYSKQELVKILEEHGHHIDAEVDEDEERIATGALTFGDKTIASVMTPRSMVSAVDKNRTVDALLLKHLRASGQSRFPVYDSSIDNVIGILYIHDLVGINMNEKQVKDLFSEQVYFINANENLDHALNAFIKTKHHLFVVINEFTEMVGVLSIEDVLEEIIGKEIVDEFDKFDDLRAVAGKKRKLKQV